MNLNRVKKDILGVKHAVAVSSATFGLEQSLRFIGVGAGAEVITTPLTFVATAEVILRLGAKPVFADIDSESLNIDPADVSRKITRRTKVILPVDLGGNPADYSALRSLARANKLSLLADSSHAFGAIYKGKSMGQLADAAVYSFQATKNLTCGEGGMVVSRTKKLTDTVRLIGKHGMSKSAHQRRGKNSWKYDVTVLGGKANMPDILASIGVGELATFSKNQKKRERIAVRYLNNLSALSELCQLPMVSKDSCHAWHLFILRLNLSSLKVGRDSFIELMSKRGIECGVHYRPLFELTYYKQLGYNGKHLPVAELTGKQILSLPMYPSLRLSDVDYVCESIRDILAKNRR